MRTKAEPGRAGFTEALASEWAKFRTVRSTRWTLAAMAAFVLGIAVFVGATRSLQPDDTVLGGSLTGVTFGLLVGASFGVLAISREYATGTIATMVAVLLLPTLVGPLLGGWERWVAGASPVAAVQKLAQSSDAAPDAVGSLGAWPSLWLVGGYV